MGVEPTTFPNAFGTLYPFEVINQSMYFLDFFDFISASRFLASGRVL